MDECSIQYCVYTSKRGNIQHTIPAKLFSSIACGKKGIVNSNSLTSEVCKKYNWGWDVDDSNTKEISKLILKLKNEWDSVSNKNSLFPFGNFKNNIDWDSQAEKLVKAYESL